MLEPNKDAEGAGGRQLPDSTEPQAESGWQRLRRITAFRPKRVLVGLDIGSEKTKVVVLHRPPWPSHGAAYSHYEHPRRGVDRRGFHR